jgi:hypothetical protein
LLSGPEGDRPFIPDELRAAYRGGDEDRAIAMLEANPALIHAHRDGFTPLHAAAALLLERMASWLIAHGADVNAHSNSGESPLDVAGCGRGPGKTGSPEQVRGMMDLLFDPDERRRLDLDPPEDTWGQPLRNCAEYGKHKIAEMLLARGADPNAHIYASGTPLFVAYGQKDRAMIGLLERHGGYLDAEMVGWLGLAEKAKQMLDDEAAGRLRKEAIPPSADSQPVAELLLIGGVNHAEILRLALPRIQRATIPGGQKSWTKAAAAATLAVYVSSWSTAMWRCVRLLYCMK